MARTEGEKSCSSLERSVSKQILRKNELEGVAESMRRYTDVHINSMATAEDGGDVEEAYERLGAVFHHDCYVDKKPEGRLFVCIANN